MPRNILTPAPIILAYGGGYPGEAGPLVPPAHVPRKFPVIFQLSIF